MKEGKVKLIRGNGGNIGHVRRKYAELTGEEWPGPDLLLSRMIQQSATMAEVLDRMTLADITALPDDPRRRPLGHVSNAELLSEIAKRPKLFD